MRKGRWSLPFTKCAVDGDASGAVLLVRFNQLQRLVGNRHARRSRATWPRRRSVLFDGWWREAGLDENEIRIGREREAHRHRFLGYRFGRGRRYIHFGLLRHGGWRRCF